MGLVEDQLRHGQHVDLELGVQLLERVLHHERQEREEVPRLGDHRHLEALVPDARLAEQRLGLGEILLVDGRVRVVAEDADRHVVRDRRAEARQRAVDERRCSRRRS